MRIQMKRKPLSAALLLCGSLITQSLTPANAAGPEGASGWSRFRGPNGSGVAKDASQLPAEFNAKKNLQWRAELPGPGSSSPIVVGEKIFITCWSGYGLEREQVGDITNLQLHLICLDRQTGKQLWKADVKAYSPEEEYRGMFAEHGYASHTPISDGNAVYAFFGKAGVYAFDMNGKQLWHKDVGHGRDPRGWGSASSPILYKDVLIVTAAAESESLYGLDKKTGEQIWKQEAPAISGTWGTPLLVKIDDMRTDLVLGVPGEVWGLSPETGKLRWYSAVGEDNSYCSSVIAGGETVYSIEGRAGGAFAIRAGGKDDVSESHKVWTGRGTNRISTPVVADNLIYFFSNKIANCIDAQTGKEVYQERLKAPTGAAVEQPAAGGPGGGFGGGGGRGGRGGGMGGQDYSSPVVGDGKIFFVSRRGDIYVIKLGSKFEQLAVNRVTDGVEDFSASPAIAGNQLLIRSSKALYSIAEKSKAE